MPPSDIASPPAEVEASNSFQALPFEATPASPQSAPDSEMVPDLEAELAKWRARVPKLAKALKERTDQVKVLEDRLAQATTEAKGDQAAGTAGLEARQKLIEELEQRQQTLKERCHGAEAKLHAQGLALEEAEADVRQWRTKWQELTVALDEHSARAASAEAQVQERTQALEQAESSIEQLGAERDQLQSDHANLQATLNRTGEELERLRTRNAQLNETTEFANRQIESLSASCEQQSQEIRALRDERAGLTETLEALQGERSEMQAALAALQTERSGLNEALEAERDQAAAIERSLRDEVGKQQQLLARLSQRLEASTTQLNRQSAAASVQALEAVALAQLQDATSAALDAERNTVRQLAAQVETLTNEREGLAAECAASQQSLNELSALKQRQDELLAERTALLSQLDELQLTRERVEAELATERQARADEAEAAARAEAALREREQVLIAERDARTAARPTLSPQLEAELEIHFEARTEAEQAAVLLQGECQRIERQLSAEQEELNAARDHNDQISQALVCAQQAHAELEEQRSKLADRVRALEEEVQYAASDRSLLEQERHQRDVAAALVFSLEQQLAGATSTLPAADWSAAANDSEYPQVEVEAEAEGTEESTTPEATLARMDAGGVDKMVLVLNQQLADARAENERLQARLRKLERNGAAETTNPTEG